MCSMKVPVLETPVLIFGGKTLLKALPDISIMRTLVLVSDFLSSQLTQAQMDETLNIIEDVIVKDMKS